MNSDREIQERRSQGRQEVGWRSHLILAAGKQPCDVSNLSCHGVQIVTETPLAIASEISVDIAHLGEFSGTVVWREGKRYGIKFDSFSSLIWQFLGCWTSFENMARIRRT